MHIDSLIAIVKDELDKYEGLSFIQDRNLYDAAESAMKKMGETITEYDETVIEVVKRQCALPHGLTDIIIAFKCEPAGCQVDPPVKAVPQMEFGYIEKTARGYRWDSCDECCIEEHETKIVEKLYIYDREVKLNYKDPVLLKLGKSIRKDPCYDKYRKRFFDINLSEINMDSANKNLYAEFDGFIYMIYKRIPMDDKGKIIVPETPKGILKDYIIASLYKRIFQKVFMNGDDPNTRDKFLYWNQEANRLESLALSECKMMTYNPATIQRARERRKDKISIAGKMSPWFDEQRIKIV